MNYRLYRGLLFVSGLAGLGGVLTLIPNQGASWPNIIGYSSLCTFAPAASLYCFFIAGSVCLFRANAVKKKHADRRKDVIPGALAVAAVLVLAVIFTVQFARVKSAYTEERPDAETAATETVEE